MDFGPRKTERSILYWVGMSFGFALGLSLLPLALGSFYYGLDLTRVDLPFLCDLKSHWLNHDGIALSRAIGNGEPLFANPEAQVLYPLRWLELLFSPEWALSIGIALHLALAASGATLLAISFGISGALSVWVGLAYLMSGTTLDLITHTVYLLDAAWLGWVWAGGRLILARRGGRLGPWVVGVAAAALLLGGDPFGFVLGVFLLGVESIHRLYSEPRERKREAASRVGLIAACVAIAGLIALIQWAPSLAELRIGAHMHDLSIGVNLVWSIELPHLVAIAFSGLLTHPLEGAGTIWSVYTHWLGDLSPDAQVTWNSNPYLGLVFLTLAFLAVRDRAMRAPVFVVLTGGILAAGAHTPILPWLIRNIPIFGLFRYPSKYFVLCNLGLVILLGSTLSSIATNPSNSAARKKVVLAFTGVLLGTGLLLVALAISRSAIAGWIVTLPGSPRATAEGARQLVTLVLDAAWRESLYLAAAILVTAALWRRSSQLLAATVCLTLALAALDSVSVGPGLARIPSPLARLRTTDAKPPVFCVQSTISAVKIVRSTEDGDSEWNRYFAMKVFDLPNLNACDGLISGIPYSVMGTEIRKEWREGIDKDRASAARALGCTHLVALKAPLEGQVQPLSIPEFERIRLEDGSSPQAFRLEDPVAPVFAARLPRWISDRSEMMQAVSRSRSSGELEAIVDDPLGKWPPGQALPKGDGVAAVSVEWSGQDRATVKATGSGGGILGLRTTYAVGWGATQAGRTLSTVRVSGTFLGAAVDDVTKGPVQFDYRIPGLKWGIAALCLGLLALALLIRSARARKT